MGDCLISVIHFAIAFQKNLLETSEVWQTSEVFGQQTAKIGLITE